MKYELSQHAKDAVAEREIMVEWIGRVLAGPEQRVRDARDPALEHWLATIDEFGGRVLRVVVNPSVIPFVL